MQAPINSNKHFVQQALLVVVNGTMRNLDIVDSVVAPATANNFNVEEGSIVKAVWIELWLINLGAVGATTSFVITVEKLPANQTNMTQAQSAVLGAYPNKKNILYTTQGVLGSASAGSPQPLLRQWFKIPKGKQRMGLSDKIIINISNNGGIDFQICGMFIYKEYR